MSFDNQLAVIAAVGILMVFALLGWKIAKSKHNLLAKAVSLAILLLLALPVWYLSQFAISAVLAKVMPWNPIVNCIYLSASDCMKRPDCQQGYTDNLSATPICVYK